MALATQCPFCQTVFRVAGDQLKLRGGLVRCGQCSEVFDGGSHLYPAEGDLHEAGAGASATMPAAGAWPTLPPTPAAERNPAYVPATTPSMARAKAATPHYGEPTSPAQPDRATLAEIEAAWDLPPASTELSDQIDDADDAEAGGALMIEDDGDEDQPASTADRAGHDAARPDHSTGKADEDKHGQQQNADAQRFPFRRAGLPLQPSAAPRDAIAPHEADRHDGRTTGQPPPPSPQQPQPRRQRPAPAEIDFDNGVHIGDDDGDGGAVTASARATIDGNTGTNADDDNGRDEASAGWREAGVDDDPAAMRGTDDRREPVFDEVLLPGFDEPAYIEGEQRERDRLDGHRPAGDAAAAAALHGGPVAHDDHGVAPLEEDALVRQLGFVRRAQRQERWRRARRIGMWIGSGVLLLAAAGQSIYLGRNRIATALPATRPLLVAACARLSCSVGPQRQIEQLSIEANDLQASVPGEPALTLQLLLRNRSDTTQVWPHIELTLNDSDEKPLIRRVFLPSDYLAATPGRVAALDQGFAPNSEQSVKLSFVVAQAVASGYRVYLFYP